MPPAASPSSASPLPRRLVLATAFASILLLLALAGQLRHALPPIPTGGSSSSRKNHRQQQPPPPLPPFQPQPRTPLCADTCVSANDGTCDEGRPPNARPKRINDNNTYYLVSCDLGTDCSDCGPWPGGASNTSAWDGGDEGPIAFLRKRGYEVRARRAVVPGAGGAPLAFWFAYADPALDVDVSRSAHETGVVESGLTALAVRALEGPCGARRRWRRRKSRVRRASDPERLRLLAGGPAGPLSSSSEAEQEPLSFADSPEPGAAHPFAEPLPPSSSREPLPFADAPEPGATYPASLDDDESDDDESDDGSGLLLDVGSNFGWFSLLAASFGCRAVAWEPVPRFRAFLEWSVARNRLLERVQVRAAAVTADRAAPSPSSPSPSSPSPSSPSRSPSAKSNAAIEIVAGNRGIWGTAGIEGANLDTSIANDGDYERVLVKRERLDSVARELVAKGLLRPDNAAAAATAARGAVGSYLPASESVPIVYPRVDLLKVDVEGFEPAVVRSAVAAAAGGGGGRGGARGRRPGPRPPLPLAPPPPQLLHHVRSAALEYSPGVHERLQQWDRAADPPRMLLSLLRSMGAAVDSAGGGGGGGGGGGAGAPRPRVRIAHLPDAFVRAPPSAFLRNGTHDEDSMVAPLPKPAGSGGGLREVTRAALAHDLQDAARMARAGSGVAAAEPQAEEERVCDALRRAGLPSRGVPEGLHPCGFRSTFGHNTNVFASVRMDEVVREEEWAREEEGGGSVAVAAASTLRWRSPLPWFVPPGQDEGMGGRLCSTMTRDVFWPQSSSSPLPPAAERARILLSHRCRCPREAPEEGDRTTADEDLQACRSLEDSADACARGGSTGFVTMTEQEVEELLAHDERREAAEREEEDAV
jgi:hypothetical protein